MKSNTETFITRHEGGERAVLVQIDFNQHDYDEYLEEFRALADSAAVETLAVVLGKRGKPDSKLFIGSGKAQEVYAEVQTHKANVVIFNHELTPAQSRNLEEFFHCRVLDRTELILDIFAQRAQTYEGKLQVELAQLHHLRSRLIRGWTHLERQRGGIGLRGPGETQLETDRRLVGVRIKYIQKRLLKVSAQREQGRKARRKAGTPTISLVGYTNAGKSTLFNALTDSDVYTADQLFATLDPTLRQITLPKIGKVILADTVGFIRELPHDLVAAFRATLEETRQADLLLHVIDACHSDSQSFVTDVEVVLEEIGANQVPKLQVYNKIDLREDFEPRIDYSDKGVPKRVWLSAVTGAGFDLLRQAIVEKLRGSLVRCELVLGVHEGKLRAQLYEMNVVCREHVDAEGRYVLQVEMERKAYDRLFGT